MGMEVREIEQRDSFDVMAIQREGEILVPKDTTVIRAGDTLISQRQTETGKS